MKNLKRSTDHIPSSKLTFLGIALLSILAFILNASFTIKQNNEHYYSKLESIKEQVQNHFQQSVDNLDNQFQILIAHYASMDVLTNAIINNDREAVYDLIKNDYRMLKEHEPHLSVMHFFDTQNVTVLRMHKPQSFGDDLTEIRPIVAHVNRTQKQASGFEPGKNGITYRITTPIFKNYQHVGVVEFGINPEYFIEALSQHYKIKSQILVKTEALKHLTYATDFEEMGHYSVVYKDPFFNRFDIDFDEAYQLIHLEDKTYMMISDIYLNTYDGKELVRFQVLEDVSEFHEKFNHTLYFYILLTIAFTVLFLTILFFIFNHYTGHIVNAFNQLKIAQGREQDTLRKSQKDELTQAYNRRHFNLVMKDLVEDKAKIQADHYAVIFFDIDHFKRINDEYGHLTGDDVLKSLSRFVEHLSGVEDVLFRWGGEEFCLLLVDSNLQEAFEKAEFIRKRIEKYNWPMGLKLTVSFGITDIRFEDDLDSLQLRVDGLLYQAKEQGRNRTVSG